MLEINILLILIIIFTFVFYYSLIKYITNKNSKIFDFKKEKLKNHTSLKSIPRLENSESVFLGKCENIDVAFPLDAKHIFICGTTGSGKTVAIANFIYTAIANDLPLLIVDGKGDIGNDSILDIVQKMRGKKKLYIVDLNNPKISDKYNPFSNTTSTIIKDMLINMNEWSEEHYKLNTERYLQCVIKLITTAKMPLSFATIILYMDIDNFMTLSANLLKSGIITKEEHLKNGSIAKSSGDIAKDSIARFSNLLESEIGTIFDEQGIDIYEALKEKAIILFVLNPLLYPELSPTMGKLIVIDCKKAVSHLFTNSLGRSMFIFDEVNVYASDSFLNLVNKSRSAQVTSVLACQSLSDLEYSVNDSFKELIIENTNNYILMRQNSHKNAEEWAKIIGTKEAHKLTYQVDTGDNSTKGSMRSTREFIYHPDEIKNLGTGEAFVISKDKTFKCKVKIHKPF